MNYLENLDNKLVSPKTKRKPSEETHDLQLVKIRAIIVHEYWAHPDNYDTNDPKEMCKIDAENWNKDPGLSFDCMFNENDVTRVVVEAPEHGVSFGPLTLDNKWE